MGTKLIFAMGKKFWSLVAKNANVLNTTEMDT